jgi:outer membrane protein insertion porin family
VNFVGPDGVTPVEYEFGFDKLRYSTGVAVQWLAPLGVFRFSFAVPLNAEDALKDEFGNKLTYGDETEGFQFSIGQAF